MLLRLERPWLTKEREAANGDGTSEGVPTQIDREESGTSSVSLGDTHVWRDNGDANV